ncbi:hypothetical protein B0T24DRAFT_723928 [Lasiosphaeria ovina]|uniref:Uncharacterized protein n=1 Tax=Lasiosphaeria ovina TaxID=92902 RepID=A0AAE0MZR0_9PEZI|nr:hypothetical protein B0T24DRAFT_723928 [Lasiosphaeria ovina]
MGSRETCSAHSSDFPGAEDYGPNKARTVGSTKKAIVVGACNSSHDICQDYYEHGYDVTIVQRSSTCVVTSEAALKFLVGSLYSEGNGLPIEDSDLATISHIHTHERTHDITPDLFSADDLLVNAINVTWTIGGATRTGAQPPGDVPQGLGNVAHGVFEGFETLAGPNWTTIVLAVVGIVGLVIAVRGWRTCLFGHKEEGGRRSRGLLRLLLGWLRRLVGWVTGFLVTQDGADTANAGPREFRLGRN